MIQPLHHWKLRWFRHIFAYATHGLFARYLPD